MEIDFSGMPVTEAVSGKDTESDVSYETDEQATGQLHSLGKKSSLKIQQAFTSVYTVGKLGVAKSIWVVE